MKYLTFFMLFIFAVFFYLWVKNEIMRNDKKPPKQIIAIDKALKLFETEELVKEQVIDSALRQHFKVSKFVDTKFAWFPLDEIRQYIKYIDAIQKANPEQKISGIRVYFGRNTPQNSKKFANQQTIFLVPTVFNKGIDSEYENLNHLPFAIKPTRVSNPIKGEYFILEQLVLDVDKVKRIENFSKNKNTIIQKAGFNFANYSPPENNLTSTIFNEGELAPPPPRNEE